MKRRFDWPLVESGLASCGSAACSMKKGRQVSCIALCVGFASDDSAQLLRSIADLEEPHEVAAHGVVVKSYSILERVVILQGGCDPDEIEFMRDADGLSYKSFDVEEVIPGSPKGDPHVSFIGAQICSPGFDLERPVEFRGKLDVVRGEKDESIEEYRLVLGLAV
jgi:hypothetical protein